MEKVTECPNTDCENGMLVVVEEEAGNNASGSSIINISFGAYRKKNIIVCTECDHEVEPYVL